MVLSISIILVRETSKITNGAGKAKCKTSVKRKGGGEGISPCKGVRS